MAEATPTHDINWTNVEVVIKGDYFHAALVAYDDYKKKLLKRAQKTDPSNGTGDKLIEYLSNIDHFNFQVGFGHDRYEVSIAARASEEFPVIFGGDALYVIDGNDFKIVEKHYGK
jgi:hypothetical protein